MANNTNSKTPEEYGASVLPTKVYEALRWIIALVMPTIGLVITGLASTWGWDQNVCGQISTTLDVIGTGLGLIFCFSYVTNKASQK